LEADKSLLKLFLDEIMVFAAHLAPEMYGWRYYHQTYDFLKDWKMFMEGEFREGPF